MKVAGFCDECGEPAQELYVCSKCFRKVCPAHYAGNGLCVKCAGQEKTKPGSGKPVTKGPPSELFVPESAKPTSVTPNDVRK